MTVVLGSPTPSRFGVASNTDASFPDTPGTYTSPDGAIVVPGGSLDRWFAFRKTLGSTRGDVVVFGDSTTYGSGGNYSWLQRIRDRAVTYGFADGGKGIFAGLENLIVYDAPEVNGYVSQTFTGTPDSFDNLAGDYFYDNVASSGHTLTLQFRSTAARLWYSFRSESGVFTYTIDGGSPVTIDATSGSGTTVKFAYISGLSANTTHTIVVTNTASTKVWCALAPVNDTGFSVQKHAISGGTFQTYFYGGITPASPYTQAQIGFRYQTALGLLGTNVDGAGRYRGAPVDTAPASSARIKPALAMTHLGFNDLTNQVGGDEQSWNEYVKRFAGACYDASVDGIVISGQLPYNANWPTFGAARFSAMKAEALAQGLTFVDLLYPISGPSLSYSGGTANPHLTKVQYQTQADYLWDNLLGVA